MSALLVVLAISNVLAGLDVFRMSILTGESDNKSTTGRLWSPIDFPEGAFSMCVCNVCVCMCVNVCACARARVCVCVNVCVLSV